VHVPRPQAVRVRGHGHVYARAEGAHHRFDSARLRVGGAVVPSVGTLAFCNLGCVSAAPGQFFDQGLMGIIRRQKAGATHVTPAFLLERSGVQGT
jgi:hypothetical protein